MTSPVRLLSIGGLIFPGLDQADFTGPFEVLSRVPESEFLVLGPDRSPVCDARGLVLTPQLALAEAPPLDVLLVPGGPGVNALMEDPTIRTFLRRQAEGTQLVLAVCTGVLVLGAAGLLRDRRATTHWASHHLLPLFGAVPVDERVVVDGGLITTAGVTSGLDGALRAAALLRGDQVAQEIQLYMEYAPSPPFFSGSPHTAPAAVLASVQASLRNITREREAIARRVMVQR